MTSYSPQICGTLTFQGAECLPSYKYPGTMAWTGPRYEAWGGHAQPGSERPEGREAQLQGRRREWGPVGGAVSWWTPWPTDCPCLSFPFCQLGTRTPLFSGPRSGLSWPPAALSPPPSSGPHPQPWKGPTEEGSLGLGAGLGQHQEEVGEAWPAENQPPPPGFTPNRVSWPQAEASAGKMVHPFWIP